MKMKKKFTVSILAIVLFAVLTLGVIANKALFC